MSKSRRKTQQPQITQGNDSAKEPVFSNGCRALETRVKQKETRFGFRVCEAGAGWCRFDGACQSARLEVLAALAAGARVAGLDGGAVADVALALLAHGGAAGRAADGGARAAAGSVLAHDDGVGW